MSEIFHDLQGGQRVRRFGEIATTLADLIGILDGTNESSGFHLSASDGMMLIESIGIYGAIGGSGVIISGGSGRFTIVTTMEFHETLIEDHFFDMEVARFLSLKRFQMSSDQEKDIVTEEDKSGHDDKR